MLARSTVRSSLARASFRKSTSVIGFSTTSAFVSKAFSSVPTSTPSILSAKTAFGLVKVTSQRNNEGGPTFSPKEKGSQGLSTTIAVGLSGLLQRLFSWGTGGYGNVFSATELSTGRLVAIKKINRFLDAKKSIRREAEILDTLRHPSIVQLYNYFEDDENLYLVLEHCQTDLRGYIKEKKRLDEKEAQKLFVQLLQGVAYLHDRKIVHRDLKPGNILLTKSGHLKIADFGMAKQIDEEDDDRHSICGTLHFLSPEMVEKLHYGLSTDYWSLGGVLFYMLVGKYPFALKDNEKKHVVIDRIRRLDYVIPAFVSEEASDLIRQLFSKDPLRPGYNEIINHRWLSRACFTLRPIPSLGSFRNFITLSTQFGSFSITSEGELHIKLEPLTWDFDFSVSPDRNECRIIDKLSKSVISRYSVRTLPLQYWPIYNHISAIVNRILAKTYKVTYYADQCRATLMESMCDFEVTFNNNLKLHFNSKHNKWKILDSAGHTDQEIEDAKYRAQGYYEKCVEVERSTRSIFPDGSGFPAYCGLQKRKLTAGTTPISGSTPASPATSVSATSNVSSSTSLPMATTPLTRSSSFLAGSKSLSVDSLGTPSLGHSTSSNTLHHSQQCQFSHGHGWVHLLENGETVIYCLDGERVTLSKDGYRGKWFDSNGTLIKGFQITEGPMEATAPFEERYKRIISLRIKTRTGSTVT